MIFGLCTYEERIKAETEQEAAEHITLSGPSAALYCVPDALYVENEITRFAVGEVKDIKERERNE